ncbi:MAG: NUDIX domain-containing protein [Cyclobacteriaceae bacterium]
MRAAYCQKCASPLMEKEKDGYLRQVCSSEECDQIFWNNPIPVVAGIIEYDGNIILIQNVGWPKEWYGLVTGYLEKGETPEQGMLRELKEELGLEGEIQSFVGNYSFFEKNELILAYHVTAKGDIIMGDELADYKIIPIEKVKPWPFATGIALGDWLERRKAGRR